ncbi:MAG: MMPL family transporter, partial [Thermoguttaceae bacterium]
IRSHLASRGGERSSTASTVPLRKSAPVLPADEVMKQPFYSRNYFKIILALVFLAPFISRGARLAIETNNNNVRDWLPPTFSESADLEWFQTHFPGEQFALVSWDECTLGNTEKLDFLASLLESAPPTEEGNDATGLFKNVITGPRALEELTAAPLGLSYGEAIRRLEGALVGPRPEGGDDDDRTTCLVVMLSDFGKENNRNMRRAIEKIEELAVKQCAVAPATLRMGGPPVDNVTIDVEGERTLFRLAGAAGIAGLVLSYWCLRSLRLTALVFAVGVLSAGLGLAMVFYYSVFETLVLGRPRPIFGTVDAILMSMPAVVYVLGISGAIHLINYYRDARREHGIVGAAESAMRHGWGPCTLAALTTAVGLGSLYTSDILPIQKFGAFSAAGVIGTLALLFTLLPACLHRFPPPDEPSDTKNSGKRRAEPAMNPFMVAVSRFVIRRNKLVCAVWAVVIIAVGFGLTKIETSVQLLKLFDHKSDIIEDYAWLEHNLGNLVPMEVVLRVDPAAVNDVGGDAEANGRHYKMDLLERMELSQHVQSRIEGLAPINKAMSAATFAPQVSAGKSVIESVAGASRRRVTNSALEKHRDQLFAGDYLRMETTALARLGDGLDPAGDRSELWRINARVGALDDIDYAEFANNLRQVVDPVLLVYRQRDLIMQGLHERDGRLRGSNICVLYDDQAAPEESKQNSQRALLRRLLNEAGATATFFNLAELASKESSDPGIVEKYRNALALQDCVVIATGDGKFEPAELLDRDTLVVNVASAAEESESADASITAVYTGVIPLV